MNRDVAKACALAACAACACLQRVDVARADSPQAARRDPFAARRATNVRRIDATVDAPAAAPASTIPWKPIGRSIERRALEYVRFGNGKFQVLVVGPLNGNQPEGLVMADRLAQHLTEFPRACGDATVTILRDPNPDGRALKSAGNARGVLLDANFATRRWQQRKGADKIVSGNVAESEPETRIVADLIADSRPDRVVLLSTGESRATIAYSRTGYDLAQKIRRQVDAELGSLDSVRGAGSLAVYAGHDRQIETVVLRVTPGQPEPQIWTAWRRAIVVAVSQYGPPGEAEASVQPDEAKGARRESTPATANTEEPSALGPLVPVVRVPATGVESSSSAPSKSPKSSSTKRTTRRQENSSRQGAPRRAKPSTPPPSDASSKEPSPPKTEEVEKETTDEIRRSTRSSLPQRPIPLPN